MAVMIRCGCDGVDFGLVRETLKTVGMGYHDAEVHEKAFRASHTAVFAYDGPRLAGFGRAVSDGAYQAALYDVAVAPAFQGKGLGALIVNALLSRVPGCNVILYASPGKEGFYRRQGFRRMKTGMALFTNAEAMAGRGFTE